MKNTAAYAGAANITRNKGSIVSGARILPKMNVFSALSRRSPFLRVQKQERCSYGRLALRQQLVQAGDQLRGKERLRKKPHPVAGGWRIAVLILAGDQ